jgi:hypothetical protein
MRAPLLSSLLLLAGLCGTILFTPAVHTIREQYQQERISQFGSLPSSALSALVLEFKGVAADYLLLKVTTFSGYKLIQKQKLSDEERGIILLGLEKITDLDPHFWDPYVFAEGEFAWEAGKAEEVEPLLLKAAKYRTDDYRPYYFLGFNRYFFLKDTPKAAEYLRLAATKPGCPDYLKNLAARLSLYGNQTAVGVIFLQDLLQEAHSGDTRAYLSKRLEAMEAILTLEKAVLSYYKKLNAKPASIEDLVKEGLISEIPIDPYGGNWFIMPNGRVYSTSKLVESHKNGH